MDIVNGILGTLGGQIGLAATVVWAFGLFRSSVWYGKVREAVGRGAEAAGAAVSAIGTTKLKGMWDPIEGVICDFVLFAAEQFSVGLRKDNPEKMATHLDRLESVGSRSRADALAAKLGALETKQDTPKGPNDAEVLAQAVAAGDAAQAQHLKE
jgi:hypothetical protein